MEKHSRPFSKKYFADLSASRLSPKRAIHPITRHIWLRLFIKASTHICLRYATANIRYAETLIRNVAPSFSPLRSENTVTSISYQRPRMFIPLSSSVTLPSVATHRITAGYAKFSFVKKGNKDIILLLFKFLIITI